MNYRLCAFADEADPLLTGQIAAMQRNGISLLEIRGVDGENISVLSPAKVKEVAHLLKENGLGVEYKFIPGKDHSWYTWAQEVFSVIEYLENIIN